jgi:L-lactate utilization protein LutC
VNQLVPDLEGLFVSGGALDKDDLPRAITAITGPSRTADIEQTLTVGVHGPGKFCAIVVG